MDARRWWKRRRRPDDAVVGSRAMGSIPAEILMSDIVLAAGLLAAPALFIGGFLAMIGAFDHRLRHA
jgi:hypothetical protein